METVKIENAQEFDSFLRSHPKGHMMQSSSWGKVKKEWEKNQGCYSCSHGRLSV